MTKAVIKKWGREVWIVNNKKYCGKLLLLKCGWRSSRHFHKIKDETFYILEGTVLMEYFDAKKDKLVELTMIPEMSIHIPPRMIHRFTGLEDSKIIEFSTHHIESDSYRLTESEQINVN